MSGSPVKNILYLNKDIIFVHLQVKSHKITLKIDTMGAYLKVQKAQFWTIYCSLGVKSLSNLTFKHLPYDHGINS